MRLVGHRNMEVRANLIPVKETTNLAVHVHSIALVTKTVHQEFTCP